MILERIDGLNLAHFLSGMADGVIEQAETLPEDHPVAEALRDYFSQLVSVSEALSEFAADGRPLDWDDLDDKIGTEVIRPDELPGG
jgi:hypothetical protein